MEIKKKGLIKTSRAIDVYVKCPFYGRSTAVSITCEGVFSSEVINKFDNPKETSMYMLTKCCRHYEECELHQKLLSKYMGGKDDRK